MARAKIAAGGLGLAIALMLFVPITPSALAQIDASALGHRFDWIGSAHHAPLAMRIGVGALALLVGAYPGVGPSLRLDHADQSAR